MWTPDCIIDGWNRREQKKLTIADKSRKKLILYLRRPHCVYCHRFLTFNEATLDHVIAQSEGGSDRLENLVLACHRCNHSKGALSVDAFRNKIERKLKRKNRTMYGGQLP